VPPTDPTRSSLSLVIPMFNEEHNVRPLLEAAFRTLPRVTSELEVVLVDDGSTDRTAERAEAGAHADARIRLLRHPQNRGLGAALRTGFAAARHEVVLYTDADLPFDLAETARALALLAEADHVAGYRLNPQVDGPRRAAYRAAYRRLIHALFGLAVPDVNFALKVVRRSLLERLPLRSEGSFIDAELLIRARDAGAVLTTCGVEYHPRERGASTLGSPRVIVGILAEMARLYPGLRASRRRR
jgi:glycosyltransferase involved in cell wall biosynthesis